MDLIAEGNPEAENKTFLKYWCEYETVWVTTPTPFVNAKDDTGIKTFPDPCSMYASHLAFVDNIFDLMFDMGYG